MGHVESLEITVTPDTEVQRGLRVLDVAPFGVLSASPVRDASGKIVDFRYIAANAANHFLIGLTPKQIVGSTVLELFPQLRDDGVLTLYRDVVEHGRSAEFELHFTSEGNGVWFQVSVNRSGPDEIAVTYTDVTETKRIQQVLSDLNTIASAETALEQTINDVLNLGRRAFGCAHAILSDVSAETFVVRGVVSDFPEVDSGATRFPLSSTLCSDVVEQRKVIACHDLGGQNDAHHPAMPSVDVGRYIGAPILISDELFGTICFFDTAPKSRAFSDTEIEMVRAMAQTLSARIRLDRTKAELQSSRDELQFIFDNVPARIWYKDDQNRILRLNKLAANSMNMTVESATGADTYELFPEMAHKYHMDDLQVIRSGAPLMGIIEEYTPLEGKRGWSLTDKVPLLDPLSKNNRLLVVAQDFTPLKDAQQELAIKNTELERSNEDLQRFGAVISHDLKAPLRHMKILSELLIDVTTDNEQAVEFAGLIRESAEKAQAMIRALREFSNVGRTMPNFAEVNISEMVQNCLDMMEDTIVANSANIQVGDLPVLNTDPTLCAQVIQNLLENALKYSSDDAVEITISSEQRERHVQISIADNGPGIDPRFKETVFEIFKRLSPDDQGVSGEGVGLATCRRIVERLGGEIWLDTDYTSGARFCFTLPVTNQ